jgi:hypothetical protein
MNRIFGQADRLLPAVLDAPERSQSPDCVAEGSRTSRAASLGPSISLGIDALGTLTAALSNRVAICEVRHKGTAPFGGPPRTLPLLKSCLQWGVWHIEEWPRVGLRTLGTTPLLGGRGHQSTSGDGFRSQPAWETASPDSHRDC